MIKSLSLFRFSILIFLLSSCSKDNPVNSGTTGELIPLKVGNTWISTFSNYDSNRVVTNTQIESLWVSKDTIVEGLRYFLLIYQVKQSNGVPSPQILTYLARNSPSGYSQRQIPVNLEERDYTYPFQVSDSAVLSSSESITVPAGTFNCIVYQYGAGLIFSDSTFHGVFGKSYICPNVGIIRRELFNSSRGYLEYRSVLTAVILK